MHSLNFNDCFMHYNGDLSGDVIFVKRGEEFTVPGELIRSYIRKYLLGRLHDEFSDLLYRQLDEYGGKHHPDRLSVLDKIDQLSTISTTDDSSAVLHGTRYLFGSRVHITFVRVVPQEATNGDWRAEDPAFQDELDNVRLVAGSQGRLEAIDVPGYKGKYIAYTFPYEE